MTTGALSFEKLPLLLYVQVRCSVIVALWSRLLDRANLVTVRG